MGYETPSIDRIAREGDQAPALLWGAVVHPRGRAAFLTGQHGIRTGLTQGGIFPARRWV